MYLSYMFYNIYIIIKDQQRNKTVPSYINFYHPQGGLCGITKGKLCMQKHTKYSRHHFKQ